MAYDPSVKIRLEISDHLLQRAKRLAAQEKTTLRNLAEEGLTRVLSERQHRQPSRLEPVTFKGRGLTPAFQGATWEQFRDAAYAGHGA